jgi:hypothetical protein
MNFCLSKSLTSKILATSIAIAITGCGSKVSGELGETPDRLLDQPLAATVENKINDSEPVDICASKLLKKLTPKNIKLGVTICGIEGKLIVETDSDYEACTSEGQIDCLPSSGFAIVETSTVAAKVAIGQTVAGVSGTAGAEAHVDCTADGVQGCITTAGFISADTTLAISTNIKAGVIIAGQTGDVTLPPAGDVELGTTYGAGGNEFTGDFTVPNIANVGTGVQFGASGTQFTGTSAGEAHILCTAEGTTGCITDATYNSALITGLASKVLSGQSVGGVAGNITLPLQSNVKTGSGTFGVAGTGSTPSYTPDFPDVANVHTGDTTDGVTGTLTLPTNLNVKFGSGVYGLAGTGSTPGYSADFPDVGNVLSSDTVNGSNGTLTLPLQPNVKTGSGTYGVAGTGSTPSYTPDFPDVANVHTGDTTDGVTGTLTLPAAANVKTGTTDFGLAGTGSTPSYSADFPDVANVHTGDTTNNA